MLSEILDDVVMGVTPRAGRRGVAIINEVGSQSTRIQMDRVRFSKAIRYLLAQEVRRVPSGGTVRIEVLPQLQRGWSHEVRLRVAGEPAEAEGTAAPAGLGHHLVQEILRRQNGDLRISASSGITLTLPTTASRDVAPESQESSRQKAA